MSSGFDVAERARKEMQEIGGKCGNNNKYTHWYSDNVENIGYNFWWCAAFVSYVVRQCGVPTSIVPNYSYCLTVLIGHEETADFIRNIKLQMVHIHLTQEIYFCVRDIQE